MSIGSETASWIALNGTSQSTTRNAAISHGCTRHRVRPVAADLSAPAARSAPRAAAPSGSSPSRGPRRGPAARDGADRRTARPSATPNATRNVSSDHLHLDRAVDDLAAGTAELLDRRPRSSRRPRAHARRGIRAARSRPRRPAARPRPRTAPGRRCSGAACCESAWNSSLYGLRRDQRSGSRAARCRRSRIVRCTREREPRRGSSADRAGTVAMLRDPLAHRRRVDQVAVQRGPLRVARRSRTSWTSGFGDQRPRRVEHHVRRGERRPSTVRGSSFGGSEADRVDAADREEQPDRAR